MVESDISRRCGHGAIESLKLESRFSANQYQYQNLMRFSHLSDTEDFNNPSASQSLKLRNQQRHNAQATRLIPVLDTAPPGGSSVQLIHARNPEPGPDVAQINNNVTRAKPFMNPAICKQPRFIRGLAYGNEARDSTMAQQLGS